MKEFNIDGDIMSNEYKWAIENYGVIIPSTVRAFFNENKDEDIQLNINSNGGDVFAGIEISNIIKEHKGKVIANIQGVAASSASIIALSCDEIKMSKSSFLMIHKPFCYAEGNSIELKKTIELLDKIQDSIIKIYLEKTKTEDITYEVLNDLVDNETWLNGEEASKYFNVVLDDKIKVFNKVNSLINHKNQPLINSVEKNEKKEELLKQLKELKKI